MHPIEKILGLDFELSNAIESEDRVDGSVNEAAVKLLAQIPGYPRRKSLYGSQIEMGRRFLSANGGSAYIDSTHLEENLPEHARAIQHPVLLHATLQSVRKAQQAAAAGLPAGSRLNVIANSSDGHQSWGTHLNVLVHLDTWLDILHRKPHQAGFFATHLVTSIPYSGQGQVGAGNHRANCSFQLSQRADWFEVFASLDTMQRRGLLNTRGEHHAEGDLARMHIIFFDMVLSPLANLLRAGTTQLVLAMCEAGWADPTLQLDNPLEAVWAVSRDLSLAQKLPTAVRGRSLTALEIQRALADLAGEFIASGEAGNAVPDGEYIVAEWRKTLDILERRDLDAAAARTDCWLKYLLVDRQRARRGLSWRAPEVKVLDLMFASLDDGLFFQMAQAGVVEGMPSAEQLALAVSEPPDDTRAYLRAHVLRRWGDDVWDIDWSHIDFRVTNGGHWYKVARLSMPDPRALHRQQSQPLLEQHDNLNDLVDAVSAVSEVQQPATVGGRRPNFVLN